MTDRVDAHHHLLDVQRHDYSWMNDDLAAISRSFSLADLTPELAASAVTQTVVVQAATTSKETEDLLAIASDSPVIAGVVGWVDLQMPDVSGSIARLRGRPGGGRLVGIRHPAHDEADPDWLARPAALSGLFALAEAGLAFDLLVRERELPAAQRAVAAVPELRFVLDHAAKPPIADGRWQPWADAIAAISEFPNVSCKLSGLVTEAAWSSWRPEELKPYVGRVVDLFGTDRCLFGSDWPVCTLAAGYGEVVATLEWLLGSLSAADRDAVFGANARRIYGLEAP